MSYDQRKVLALDARVRAVITLAPTNRQAQQRLAPFDPCWMTEAKAMFKHLHKHFKRSAAARRTPAYR